MRTEFTLCGIITRLLDLGQFDGIYGGGPVMDYPITRLLDGGRVTDIPFGP